MYDFRRRVVVVTGGGQGIGRATADAFLAAGATVIVWDKTADASNAVPSPLVDVSDAGSVARATTELLARHLQVDVLINNAGVNVGDQTAFGLSDATWEHVVGTSLKGTANVVRAVGPAMVRRKQGRIINTGSILGRAGVPGFSAYAAAKAGIEALTRTWARELGPYGVTVNAVVPGFIDTPLNAGLPKALVAELIARTPLGRPGLVQDVANAHLFLASDAAAFVNGALLHVDGGLTL